MVSIQIIQRSEGSSLVRLNYFNYIFRHLKLAIALAIPASNDEKYFYSLKISIFLIELFVQLSISHKLYYPFQWNVI